MSVSESIQVHSVTEFTIYFQTAGILKTDLTTNTFLCVKGQVQLNFNSTTIGNVYFTRIFFLKNKTIFDYNFENLPFSGLTR